MKKPLQRDIQQNISVARNLNRRDFLYGMGSSLGSIALAGLLPQELAAASSAGPLSVKKPHLPQKRRTASS